MANKKIRMNEKNASGTFDILHPETTTEQVIDITTGESIAEHFLDTTKKHIEIVDNIPVSLQGKGIFFKRQGSTSNAPERPMSEGLEEHLSEVIKKHIEIVDEIPQNLKGKGVFFKRQGGTSNTPNKPISEGLGDHLLDIVNKHIQIVDEVPENATVNSVYFKRKEITSSAPNAPVIQDIYDSISAHASTIATTMKLGHVKPDGVTITIDDNGVISSISGGSGGSAGDHLHSIGQITGLNDALNSKASLASPTFTGTPTAPTANSSTNNTQIATTAFVNTAIVNKTTITGNAGSATKLQTARTINGVSFDGTANITISDNTKAPLESPALTGTPTAPTASTTTNNTQIATTAFVRTVVNATTGTLSSLATSVRTTIVAAINELKSTFDTHSGDTEIHTSSVDKAKWNGKYTKPTNGIPYGDLESAIRTKLDSVVDATLTQRGTVQLTDNIYSFSTTTAATPNSIRKVNDALENHKMEHDTHLYWLGDTLASGSSSVINFSRPEIDSYPAGLGISFRAKKDFLDGASVNINSMGAKPLKDIDGEYVVLKKEKSYTFRYNEELSIFTLQDGSGGASNLTNVQNDFVTIYVNPTGSDANTGLTASTPVKTIAKAIELVKNLGAKERRIELAANSVFNEDVKFEDIHGSAVYLMGQYNQRATVKGFTVQYCSAEVRILHCDVMVKGAITQVGIGAWIDDARLVTIAYCSFNGVSLGIRAFSSNVQVTQSSFNNIMGGALEAMSGSYFYVDGLTGTNTASTSSSYDAIGSIIIGNKGTLTSATLTRIGSGGQIFFSTT